MKFSKLLNDLWERALGWVLKDPLAIDIDGDGIETVGVDAGVQFDHNGDGIKTGTGWLKGDDAFVVLDRNGNGLIDNGSELFGVDTVVGTDAAGKAIKAKDGFDALKSIDSNGDGAFNSADALYGSVRLWRDTNQDGVSQADELVSLADAGITSIDLNAKSATKTLAGGNTQTLGANVAGIEGDAAALNLADNPFYRTYTDHLDTSAVMDLPDMQGSGLVRDLREAATQSADLQAQLRGLTTQGYVNRDTYLAEIKALIDAWADTSSLKTEAQRKTMSSADLAALGNAGSTSVGLHKMDPTVIDGQMITGGLFIIYQPAGVSQSLLEARVAPKFAGTGGGGDGAADLGTPLNLTQEQIDAQMARWARTTYLIETLERYNGQTFINLQADGSATTGAGQKVQIGTSDGSGGGPGGGVGVSYVSLSQIQIDLLEQSYAELVQSVSDGLILQTRLKGYMDSIDLVIDPAGIKLDYTRVDQMLQARYATNAKDGLGDLVDLLRTNDKMLVDMGWTTGIATLRTWAEELSLDPSQSQTLTELGIKRVEGNFTGTGLDEMLLAGTGNDLICAGAGNDIVYGGDGDDILYGGDGNDVLEGGAGNDSLSGDAGNDSYLFGKGDGQDTIRVDYDTSAGKSNVLQFKAGVTASEIVATRSGSDLVLSIAGTSDKVTVSYFFGSDDPTNASNPIQQVMFDDGTVWNLADIVAKVFAGTAGADSITGTVGNDTVSGQGGNDTLYGGEGNDTLNGGADNDTLFGGAGNDTYLFGRGDGQDTIRADYDTSAGKSNVLRFKAGVTASEIVATRSGTDLVLSIAGTTDKVTVSYFFSGDDPANASNPIQQVMFDDGTVWNLADIVAQAFAGTVGSDSIIGTSGNDVIYGQGENDGLYGGYGNDTLYGGDGNDTLDGSEGNDVLDGGTGDDILSGGAGNDTYLFGKGDGQDTIRPDYDSSAGKNNVLRFKAGVAASEIVATRSGSDLVLGITGTPDKVTVSYFFNGDDPANASNPIQQVVFDDGTTWDVAELTAKVFGATAGADNIIGTSGNDVIYGQGGADWLYGQAGNDTLNGGADNDTLDGGEGNDVLDGGTGNDTLFGAAGNDTFLFGRGDGQDTIRAEYDTSAGKSNVLRFKAGVTASEIVATRSGTDLVLSIAGTTDKVTVSYFFSGDDPANARNPIQQVMFDDGTVWNTNDLVAKVFAGTVGADNIIGTSGNDVIYGQGGADWLYGQAGNDTLNGGDGNDILNGDAGNDILDGGAGNDSLYGGIGNDTYVLGGGYGADTVTENDSTAGNTDVASFLTGIGTDQVWFRHVGTALEVSIIGTSDKLTVNNWYSGSAYHIEQFKTADGKTLTDTDVESLVQAMASFTPPAAGQTTLPTNYQTALQPVIAANWQ